MKKIREAYHAGLEGKDAPEKGSVQRVAHRIGRRSLAKTVEQNEQMDRQFKDRFNKAETHAKGANKQAMQVLKAAADIPHQASTYPLWGIAHLAELEGGESRVSWTTHLSAGQDQDPTRPSKSPLVESLGTLKLDSPHWSHNGFTISVDNVSITCEAPLNSQHEPGSPTTKIHINTRPYDADNIALDDKYDFTGSLTLTLDADGNISELGMTNSSYSGYHDEDPTGVQANLAEFLEGVQAAANQTAQTYRQLGDSL